MKSVKQIAFAALLTVGAFSAVTLVSCSKDDDTGCPVGMEGKNCADQIRAKYLGSWTAVDKELKSDGTSESLPSYNAIITENTNSISQVNIGKFSDAFYVKDVVVSTLTSSFTIPDQDPDGDGYSVQGSGQYSATASMKTITIDYTITEAATQKKKTYSGSWTQPI